MKIIKNFLPEAYLYDLNDLLMGKDMPWFFQENSLRNKDDGSFMFTHAVYFKEHGWVGNHIVNSMIRPMLWNIKDHLNYSEVSRIKCNLTTNQKDQIRHPKHLDWEGKDGDKYKIAIFHMNTCNGYTQIGDHKIENEKNQLIIADNVEHCYATSTNTKIRVVINFNFIV